MRCRHAAASGAWRRCASVAARPLRSPWRWREAEKRGRRNFPAKPLDTRQRPVEIGIGAQLRVVHPTTRNVTMSINKALLAVALGIALAACTNQQQAADSAAEAADAAGEAQQAADNAAATRDAAAADAAQPAADTAAAAADAAASAATASAAHAGTTDADDAADAAENAADAAEQAQDAAEEAAGSADAPTNNDGTADRK